MFHKKTDLVRDCKKGFKRRLSFFRFKKSALCMILFFAVIAGGVFLLLPQKEVEADVADPWYNTEWAYRKAVTIPFAGVSNTDQVNFPVLVSKTDVSLKSLTNSGKVSSESGYDIVFTSKDGATKLDHEIESYDPVTGTIVMWVKVPILSHTVDTILYVYYGNSAITTTQENKIGVWDNNFKMVQHMNQDPSGVGAQMLDSTSNVNDGTSNGTMTGGDKIVGQIGGALDMDGADDYINHTASDSLNITGAVTLEAWVKIADTTTRQYIVSKYAYNLRMSSAEIPEFETMKADGSVTDTNATWASALAVGNWYHLVGIYNPATGQKTLYVNGVAGSAIAKTDGAIPDSSARNLQIGKYSAGSFYASDDIDEVRVSNSVRSSDWIATEYNNQSSPAVFCSFGEEEIPIASTPIPSPAFSPVAGTYSSSQSVTLSSSTSGATIYYTIDGSDPTVSSSEYSSPLTISSSTTIKAFAVAPGHTDSAIATADYTITSFSETPAFSPSGGTCSSSQSVSLTSSTPDAIIYYTIDGSDPTVSSSEYSSSLTISSSTTIKAFAVAPGHTDSAISMATYIITSSPTVYYVDSSGNDTSDGLSSLTAWGSIQKAANAAVAGDTVNVGGTFNLSSVISIANSGDEAQGWIKFLGHDDAVLIGDGTVNGDGTVANEATLSAFHIPSYASYIQFDGFRISNVVDAFIADDHVHHLTFSNNNVQNHSGTAFGSWTFGHDIIVDNNYAQGNGGANSRSVFSHGNSGATEQLITNVTITNNNFSKGGHDCINIHTRNRNLLIENNTLSYCTNSAAIMLHNFAVDTVTIRNNHISQSSYGMYIIGSKNLLIEGNTVDTFGYYKAGILFYDVDVTGTDWGDNNGVTNCAESSDVTIRNNSINSTQDYANSIRFWNVCTQSDPDPAFSNFTIDGNTFLNSTGAYDISAESSVTGISFLNSKDSVNENISYDTASESNFSDGMIKYTDNRVVEILSGILPYRYYPTYAEGIIPETTGWNVNTQVYLMTSTPSFGYLEITVNTIDRPADIWDIDVSSSTPENPATFTLETINHNTVYSVRRDNIEIDTATTDGDGDLTYVYQTEGDEFDSSHNFKFVSTGLAPVAVAPAFSVAPGTYASAQTVSLSTTTSGAAIYYTSNGDTPTVSSTLYSSAISVATTATIKAIAIATGYTDSEVATAAYTINPASSPYLLTVTNGTGSGSYTEGQTITITAASAPIDQEFDQWTGDTAYITTGSVSSSSVTLTMPASAISLTATYKEMEAAAIPAFSPASGTYSSTQSVAIVSVTAGASIYYTTDGNSPTVSSTPYTVPVSVSTTTTLKAIAVKTGYLNSPIATASYTISHSSGGGGGGGSSTHPKPKVNKAEIVSVDGNLVNLSFSVTDAAEMSLSSSATFTSSSWEKYQTTKAYTKTDNQSKLYLKFKSSYGVVSDMSELTIPSPTVPPVPPTDNPNTASPYPTGTLIKLSDSFRVYAMIDNKKKWIPTPEVFQQLGYKWTEIKVLTPDQLKLIPDFEDNLIRALGNYKVYLVVNGVKRHIPNPKVFLNYGFLWTDVVDVPQETVDKYKATYLVRENGEEEIYYLREDGVRKHIPSSAIFNSYGDKWEDVQIVSKTEMEFYSLSKLIKLSGGNDVYLIEGTVKKRIPSPQIFTKYQLDWNHVMSVNRAEFDFYQDWGELE